MTEAERSVRRTAILFAASQAIVGSAAPISIALGGLAGHYLLDADKSLATAPVTGFTAGVAIAALPAAALIKRIGQRAGFMTGCAVTSSGGAIATLALFESSFWLLVLGTLVIGFGGAFVQLFRFAAADNAPPEFKARAISFVLAGGVVTAVLGPQIVIFTSDMLAPVMFAGSFLSIILLGVVGAVILSFLRPIVIDPGKAPPDSLPARLLLQIIRQPSFAAGLLCGVGSYALMSFVMTGAPLAMVGCGFSADQATLGISWHVMAMFGPSFFTGRLIARFGREAVIACGLLLLVGCALVALSGIELWQFWTALILLGIGWNFGFIGSTAMVAETYRPSEKGKAQGFHDFVLFTTVALSSLASGLVYNEWGWEMLNWVVFPVVALCVVGLVLTAAMRRRKSVTIAP